MSTEDTEVRVAMDSPRLPSTRWCSQIRYWMGNGRLNP